MSHTTIPRLRSRRARRTAVAGATAGVMTVGVLALAPAAASGADGEVTAQTAAARNCQASPATGAGIATRTATAPADALLRTRLTADGDWDVAVFDQSSNRLIASSSGFGGSEVASGFVRKGQDLLVQTCRQPGGAVRAVLATTFEALGEPNGETLSLVEVATPDRKAKERLQGLGLDLTEHGTETSVEAVLHGKADESKLHDAGFTFTTEIGDLAERSKRNRTADAEYAAETPRSALPSGRTEYRRLGDYETEMKALAALYPDLVKPLTLPHKTVEGRSVHGIEITTDAANTADGKPVFLNMGVHHAREWPSGEHAMEWAHELLTGYGKDALTTRIVRESRTIIVPIVNPDGFNVSREAGTGGEPQVITQFAYSYKRKNCAISTKTLTAPIDYRTGSCAANPAGRLRGTDPNRNYAGFWGGAGASAAWSSDTYRGDAPFSEAETRNVRDLVSSRQVTNLITNHTYSNLILRVPGVWAVRPPLEEPQYAALGQSMANRNGYTNQPSWALYDTTGGTEDWSFFNTGGFGFTFEIGPDEFHPPFEDGVVDEYLGNAGTAGSGKGGNRGAYFEMAKATLDKGLHSTLTGTAPEGWSLEIAKTFTSETTGGGVGSMPIEYTDNLSSTLAVKGGRFEWAVNPSTRPVVAGRYGREPLAPPQQTITLPNPAGVPVVNKGAIATANEKVDFEIGALPQYDNGTAVVSMKWAKIATDWDLYVFNSVGQLVGQSAQGGTNREDALLIDPPAGKYTAVVVNYAGGATDDWDSGAVTFANPLPELRTGIKEAWQLTCRKPTGEVQSVRDVIVDRGQTADLGNACKKAKEQ